MCVGRAIACLGAVMLGAMVSSSSRRPRVSGDREQEILDATVELVGEVGYDRLTFDAVSARAKVSKATLYRRWSSKAELVVDAVWSHKAAITDIDTGSLEGDLRGWVAGLAQHLDSGGIELYLGIMTAMGRDEELGRVHEARCIANPTNDIGRIFERAAARGEIPAGVDCQLLAHVLPSLGLMHSVSGTLKPPTLPFLEHVVDDLILPLVRNAQAAAAATSA